MISRGLWREKHLEHLARACVQVVQLLREPLRPVPSVSASAQKQRKRRRMRRMRRMRRKASRRRRKSGNRKERLAVCRLNAERERESARAERESARARATRTDIEGLSVGGRELHKDVVCGGVLAQHLVHPLRVHLPPNAHAHAHERDACQMLRLIPHARTREKATRARCSG
eukprot:1492636-Rhodomonas_salina.1